MSGYSLFRWVNRLSPVQLIFLFYFIAVIAATVLLALPAAQQDGVNLPFIDVLFTAVSALSVTGLSTVTIAETFSTTGIVMMAVILQLGGVGVMAVGTFIWMIIGKKIGLRERRLIMADQNQTSFAGIVRLVKEILVVILIIELIGFLILGTYFLQYFPTVKEAYFQGFFGAISATTNGGFDITGQSLVIFQDDYFVQFINMLLIIFGAIGYPVLIEIKAFLFSKGNSEQPFRFTLFTKVTTLTFTGLIVAGAVFIMLLDIDGFFSDKSWHEVLFYSLFQSVTTRSGGLSTMDVSLLSEPNHLFMSLLMFIGASPSSAGGGIRTTTFALVVIFIFTYARGKRSIRLFNREVYEEDLLKAVTVTLMAFIFVFTATVIILIVEPFELSYILFEVTSAFGTVGLSLGITENLSTLSKTIIMFLMFIGRVGIITFLFIFQDNKRSGKYHYPKEKMIIG
ncbi:Trk-type K+ transport system, membrane component [Lentibacillus persicus]|uniref:Trk-type K+ transport system, membrane component n=1 Tax=Lentibacillus persicus TaxID=640948 RepID=A0A1I1SUP6_9BACI|nr:TrkH family potassium uptake protein [Lentibacillus persicus]SFD46760.1 Trk-type K+ transport system, membrane component [Lentibacillus persicus]